MLSMPRIVRPDLFRILTEKKLVPPQDQQLIDPLSETKNWRKFLTTHRARQVVGDLTRRGQAACSTRTMREGERWRRRREFGSSLPLPQFI